VTTLSPITSQWDHAAYLDGKLSVYPGHPLTIAYIISVAFASMDEALAPPKHGGDYPSHEALANIRIPGAGSEVWGGITLLQRLRDEEITVDQAVRLADDHWLGVTTDGHRDARAPGQAQADMVKPKLAEIVAFARGSKAIKKSA
jgi:hypothetical protein